MLRLMLRKSSRRTSGECSSLSSQKTTDAAPKHPRVSHGRFCTSPQQKTECNASSKCLWMKRDSNCQRGCCETCSAIGEGCGKGLDRESWEGMEQTLLICSGLNHNGNCSHLEKHSFVLLLFVYEEISTVEAITSAIASLLLLPWILTIVVSWIRFTGTLT